jgi:hypothetical protein
MWFIFYQIGWPEHKNGKSSYVKDALNTTKKEREIWNIRGCNENNRFIVKFTNDKMKDVSVLLTVMFKNST